MVMQCVFVGMCHDMPVGDICSSARAIHAFTHGPAVIEIGLFVVGAIETHVPAQETEMRRDISWVGWIQPVYRG